MFQIILVVIASIIGLFLLAGLIMKKTFVITSQTTINRSKDEVFNYIKLIKNQEYYSKWVMADPNLDLTYTGTDGTAGFTAAWKSELKNVGVGEQEIKKITEGEGYEAEIRFEKPFKGVSHAKTIAESISDNQTKFTTIFTSRSKFPLNVMTSIICKMVQRNMDENSGNLKRVLEQQ